MSAVLEELSITGLGVLENAAAEFGPGFTVLTGETGAGKTMVVTSLHLLSGGRADASRVRAGHGKAIVEGRFRLGGDEPQGGGHRAAGHVAGHGERAAHRDGGLESPQAVGQAPVQRGGQLPVEQFVTGYRRTERAPDELILSVLIPQRPRDERRAFRKVGTRRAQSISKVVVAVCGEFRAGVLASVRGSAGSVADRTVSLPTLAELNAAVAALCQRAQRRVTRARP